MSLQQRYTQPIQQLAGVAVDAEPKSTPNCPQCASALHVRKTLRRTGRTIDHGTFRVRETVFECPSGCQPVGNIPMSGAHQTAVLTQRSSRLARLLLPRRTIGYDVMVHVGLQRWVDNHQRPVIQDSLRAKGINLSDGEISTLGRDFLVYLEALHQARAPEFRKALTRDGGWPMNIDATGESGRGTLLVVYSVWRGWVLDSCKIPTERADAILPRLHKVVELFGTPCAIMRDLGRAVTEAARDLVAAHPERNIPILGCHYHFLRDVGKDLLADAHDQLHELFRKFRISTPVRALVRDLGRRLNTDIEAARADFRRWLGEEDAEREIPTGQMGLEMVRALAQWVLDYPDDGTNEGFPFDVPELDRWRRCQTALRAIDTFLRSPSSDVHVRKAFVRLHRILQPIRNESVFLLPVAVIKDRVRLFAELRDALRLQGKSDESDRLAQTGPADPKNIKELQDIKHSIEDLARSLRERRPERGPAQQMRQAIDLILEHIERHGSSLHGHVIALPKAAGGGIRLVNRTNLPLEGFFHDFKHRERLRSGRKSLAQDLEVMPGAAMLASNLRQSDYVSILCGTLAELPKAFAELDAVDRRVCLPVRLHASRAASTDVISSSLPTVDRNLVRSDALQEWIRDAARSRAPHFLPVQTRTRIVAATLD